MSAKAADDRCRKETWTKVGLVAVLETLAGLEAVYYCPDFEWYHRLSFPPLTPPDRVFGPVWTYMYASTGWGCASLYNETEGFTSTPQAKKVGRLFAAQGMLNAIYCPIMFGKKWIAPAAVVNVACTGLVFWLVYEAEKINKKICRRFLYPYAVWMGAAAYISVAMAIMNRNNGRDLFWAAMGQK